MKNLNRLLALLLVVTLLAGYAVIPASAATSGTGEAGDPIVCEAISDVPAVISMLPGQTIYYQVPMGGQAISVSDSFEAAIILDKTGNSVGTVYDCTDAPEGYPIMFAIQNQHPRMSIDVTVTIGAAPVAEVGTEKNPAEPLWYGNGVNTWLMNTDLEAGDQDGYWYLLTAEKDGVLTVKTSSADPYYVMVNQEAYYYQGSNWEGDPIVTYPVVAGEQITIMVAMEPDMMTWEYPAGHVDVSGTILAADENDPIPMYSAESFCIPVANDHPVSFKDAKNSWEGMGMEITYGDDAVVIINNVEYTDIDGDGVIELSYPGTYYDRPAVTIVNNAEWNRNFTINIVAAAAETIPTCACGAELTYSAADPVCHVGEWGYGEMWYCATCDVYYADREATQITNPKMNKIQGTNEITHVEAVAAGCDYEGNIEYWTCYTCEKVWQDEALTQLTNYKNVITPATHNNVIHVEAVAATCFEPGNIEYWYCGDCEIVWADEAQTQVTNFKNVVTLINHSIEHVEAKAATCYENGNIEYWYCTECGAAATDELLHEVTNLKNVIVPAAHTGLVHEEAVAPACHYTGNIEHWYCTGCETVWADEALTQITNHKNVIIPALGGEVVHVEAVEAGCDTTGNIEHWYCETCEQVWADEALTQVTNHKNVIVAAGNHNIIAQAAIAAGCHYEGQQAHWYCTECETVWADEALTQITNHKNVVIPAIGGEVEHIEESCYAVEHWYCETCEQVWADEALTQLTNQKNVIKAEATHELVHVEETCYAVEHWYCEACETVWADEALTQLTNQKNVIKAEATHELVYVEESCYAVEHWYCEACETVWADEALTQITNQKNVIKAAPSHNLVHFEAVAPACHYNGNVEYWYCTECEGFWTDAAATQLTNSKNVILPAIGSENVSYVEPVAPACYAEGNIAYWTCADCQQVWTDAALTQLSNIKNVILPATHTDVEHVAESCYNTEYWYCEDCLTYWADENQMQITNSKNVIKAVPSHELTHVEESCYNTEYWTCSVCETYWADEALTQITNAKNVNKAEATHELVCVEESCYAVKHWYCEACETVWADEALTQITNQKNVIKAVPSHELTHVEESCYNVEHWTCEACETVWADEALTQITNQKNVIKAVPSHELTHVEESCYNTEYWHCEACQTVWADEALTQITNLKNVNKAEATHELVHVEESCYAVEHWYCEACETVWADEALTQITNQKNVIKAVPSHELTHVEESCYNVEYWTCSACETYWADESLTQITNAKNVIRAVARHSLVYVEAAAPTCWEEGNIEHWYCIDCDTVWANPALTQITNHKNVIIPAAHNAEYVAESCYNVAYWVCYDCETFWADEALTQITNSKNVIKAVASHNLTHVAESCYNTEHWFCDICEIYWADEALTQITNSKNVIKAEPHNMEYFARVEPTTEKNGNIEYWYCADCDSYFVKDDNGNYINTNAKSIIIPKVSTPVTGDNTSLIVLVTLMAISAMGAAVVIFGKKRNIA